MTARSMTSFLVFDTGGTSASVDISWPKPPLSMNSPASPRAVWLESRMRRCGKGWLRRQTAESRPIKNTTLARQGEDERFLMILLSPGWKPGKRGQRQGIIPVGQVPLGKGAFFAQEVL